MNCDHDWEELDFEEGCYRQDVCTRCNAYRHVDLATGRAEISEFLEDGQVLRNGNLYCGACGMLAQSGNEEYDWCDHRTGAGCAYYHESELDDEDEFDLEEEQDES